MSGKGYELLAECTVAGVPVQKLRSTRTGIVVCVVQVEGPLVNGYFCLGWCLVQLLMSELAPYMHHVIAFL